MIPFLPLVLVLIFGRQLWKFMKEPEIRAAAFAAGLMLLGGTIVYHNLEKWSWTDSIYFTTVSLATIGYGDLHPTTPTSKLFTVMFALVGIGILSAFLGAIARVEGRNQERRLQQKALRRAETASGKRATNPRFVPSNRARSKRANSPAASTPLAGPGDDTGQA